MIERAFARALALWIAAVPVQALASQSELVPPTSGIYTGVQFSQKLGDAFRSLASCNKGAVAPANVGGSVVDGMCWIDDSSTPWIIKQYVNGGWAVTGALDPALSAYAGVIGGGTASIASAATTDLGSVPQANVTITGSATISNFGSAAPIGIVKFIRFANSLTLTSSSALTVPGGYDLATAANDRAIVTHLGSGNWEVTQYTRASGVPIDVSAVGKPDFSFSGSVPLLHLTADGSAISRAAYPAYLAKVTRVQNGTRASGNATITAIADTSGLGVGMPVEATGITAGCTIASIVANTSITLNSGSCVTSSGTSPATVFLTGYGYGGGPTTIGLPDCQGRVIAGLDGGWNRLTPSYFGKDASAFNVAGGSETGIIKLGNLPPYTPIGTIAVTNGAITIGGASNYAYAASSGPGGVGGGGSFGLSGFNGLSASQALSTAVFTGTPQGGSSQPFSLVQPTLTARCVIRVTP